LVHRIINLRYVDWVFSFKQTRMYLNVYLELKL